MTPDPTKPVCPPGDFVPDYATRPVKRCKAHGLYIHSDGYVDTCADVEPTHKKLNDVDGYYGFDVPIDLIQSYVDTRVAGAWEANRMLALKLYEELLNADPDSIMQLRNTRSNMLRELYALTQLEGDFIPGTTIRPIELPNHKEI